VKTTTLVPFPSVERALMALILNLETDTPLDPAWVGGDFAFDPATMPWYIRLNQVPGGRGGQLAGDFVIDVEVFGQDYLATESVAFALDALVLGYPHVVEVDGRKVVLDEVFQNMGPAALPWEDDSVFRFGATYSITIRRH
jgi:hypothetical protein